MNAQPPIAVLKYPGSKDKVARAIGRWGILPAHTHYVEPFAGSAEVLFHKRPSAHETISDINPDLMHFYRALKADGAAMQDRLRALPYARQSWRWGVDNLRNPDLSDVERACAYFVARNQGHTARPFGSFGAGSSAAGERRVGTYCQQVVQLMAHSERLANVEIRQGDALDLIVELDAPSTLFYVDPPYLFSTRQRSWQELYEHEMGEDNEHRALLSLLNSLNGMVLLSGYPSELYERWLPHWANYDYETFVAIKSLPNHLAGTARNRVTERVWINPALRSALYTRDFLAA